MARGASPLAPAEITGDATDAVVRARRGLRRDVQALLEALRSAPLLVPLAVPLRDVEVGVLEELGEELTLTPHLLFDEHRKGYLPVFTRSAFAEPATRALGWTTDGGPLELCTLPSAVVLELGASILEDARVAGMILNPFDDGELLLRRHEVASLAAGKALPLVGYVEALPLDEDESRLVAEMDGPPPAEVTAAIEQALAGTPGTVGYRLHRTMNPERDLEPHLTLNVLVEDDDLDRGALAARLAGALDGKLPPPGYIDIVFNDPTLR